MKLYKKGDAKALRNLVYTDFTDTDCNDFWTLMLDAIIADPDSFEEIGSGIDDQIYHLSHHAKTHEFVANKILNIIAFTLVTILGGE